MNIYIRSLLVGAALLLGTAVSNASYAYTMESVWVCDGNGVCQMIIVIKQ